MKNSLLYVLCFVGLGLSGKFLLKEIGVETSPDHLTVQQINANLVKLEREVFLAGCERAFLLFMDSCCFCQKCSADRRTCNQPRMARPAPEAMAVDVYATVRQFGFPINVRTDYDQQMDRYAFLMVH